MHIITGHAHTSTSWLPDFDFTVRQKFSLTPDGATANLEVGDLSFDTSSWIVDQFKGPAISQIKKSRDRSLAETHAVRTVRDKLSADKNLGNFLRSLFDPPRKDGPPPPPGFQLAYTSVDIRPSGIVLHGSLAVPDFAPPHIEFEQIPTAGGLAGNTVFSEPSYSALKTWIPGGTIERFQWSRLGQGTIDVETHKFVLEPQQVVLGAGGAAAAIAQGYHPLCLTVTGSRLTASGPVVKQPISGGACAFTSFPLIGETAVSTPVKPPVIAVTHPGPRGELQVAGHAPLRLDASGGGSPNLLVHFADDRSVGKLAALDEALRASGRQDATTAVLAVMTPAQLEKAPFVPSVSYTEDQDGAWERLLGVSGARRPLTAIVSPKRQVLWQQQGDVDPRALADALRKYLVVRKPIKAGVSPGGARVGHPPPNILFDHSAGRALTLRKLTGRPVVLVFWKSVSKPSIDKARALLSPGYKFAGPPPLVLAVNDGDASDLARKLAAGNGLRDSLVLDPDRKISTAYGVNVWPTVVNVDAQGLVTHVDAGHDLAAAASGA